MHGPISSIFWAHFDYSKLRTFESACWIREAIIRKRESARGYRGIFIGFKPNFNAWLVCVPSRNKTMSSQDVRFDETRENGLVSQPITTENDSASPQVSDTSFSNNAQSISD